MQLLANMGNDSNTSMGNIVYLIDSAEEKDYFYIVMPYYDQGSLTSMINKGVIRSEEEAIEYFRQICYGLRLLHSLNLIHRDIKTDNVLISNYASNDYPYQHLLSIADLGLSSASTKNHTMNVGTILTNSPETKTGMYDQRADIYSLGCVFYKMLTGKEPFSGTSENQITALKGAQKLEIISRVGKLSKITMKILEGCLQYDANQRLSPKDLYDLLSISTLYSEYRKINIDEKDSSNFISLRAFTRNASKASGHTISNVCALSNIPKSTRTLGNTKQALFATKKYKIAQATTVLDIKAPDDEFVLVNMQNNAEEGHTNPNGLLTYISKAFSRLMIALHIRKSSD